MPSRRVTHETLDGHVHYPDELPRRRGNWATLSSIFIILFTFAICMPGAISNNGDIVSFVVVLNLVSSMQLVLEIIRRFTNYMEEWCHLQSRYKGSHWHLLKKLMLHYTWTAWFFIVLCVFCTSGIFVLMHDIKYHIWNVCNSWLQMMGVLIISDSLQRTLDLSKNPVSDSLSLEKLHRLDYGSGMAQNFFYGYLRLVLPNTGDQEKGIVERIEDYISQERLSEESFPVKKLFILIPSSSYLPNDLKECSWNWMTSKGRLEKQIKDRAGVKGRVYINSVYRIQDPDDENDKGVYVVAEGATPCKTLYEVVQFSGERKEFYKEHQKEIVYSFYETLRETLREDRDCRDLCEFIYYYDVDEFGLNNVNVAQLILDRIKDIEEKEEFLKSVRNRNI